MSEEVCVGSSEEEECGEEGERDGLESSREKRTPPPATGPNMNSLSFS